MPKPDSLQGALDLLVLTLLSKHQTMHGYAIMMAIQARSNDVLRAEEGSLYPALHRMEEAGWVQAAWQTNDTGRRVRAYSLTPLGDMQLAAERARWQSITAAVNQVVELVEPLGVTRPVHARAT